MLKTRIIPVLLLRNGRMVKGKQFSAFRDVGDPVSAARIYNAQNADELIFLDIDASHEGRASLIDVIERVSRECFMPFAVGGGVTSVENVRELLNAGADKVVVTTAALVHPDFISEAAKIFGNQCIVVGIDVRRDEASGKYRLYSHSGRQLHETELLDHVRDMESRGAGELFVNSIDFDGTMQGYDLGLATLVRSHTNLPVIIAGGAGNFKHLAQAIHEAQVHAVACASVFHFGDNNPVRARAYLKNEGILVKNTK
jgi:imidazole glycerol-phosphate synthase subunit HisF